MGATILNLDSASLRTSIQPSRILEGNDGSWNATALFAFQRQGLTCCKCRSEIKTSIKVKPDDEGAFTEVTVKTTDRPGLLTDIVHQMKDINVNVISAEVRPSYNMSGGDIARSWNQEGGGVAGGGDPSLIWCCWFSIFLFSLP